MIEEIADIIWRNQQQNGQVWGYDYEGLCQLLRSGLPNIQVFVEFSIGEENLTKTLWINADGEIVREQRSF